MLVIREIMYVRVRDKFSIEIEVGVVGFNFFVDKGMELIRGKSFFYIDIGNYFLVRSEKFVMGQLDVVSSYYGNLVFVFYVDVFVESK